MVSIKKLLTLILSLFFLCIVSYAQQNNFRSHAAYLEALKNHKSGNTALAEKQFKEIARRDPANDAVFFYLANIYMQRDETGNAIDALKNAIERDPNNTWYRQYLARIYTFTGQTDQAIELYDRLRIEFPLRSELYDGLIDLYIRRQEFEKAKEVLEDIEKSVGINEATGLTRYNLLIFQGESEAALDYLKDFDKQYGTPRTATVIGDSYATAGEDSIAQQYYNKALELAPDYVPASFGLAEIYRIQGEFELYFKQMSQFMLNQDVDAVMKSEYMKQILSNIRFVQVFLPQIDTLMNNMYSAHPYDSTIAYDYALFLVQSDKTGEAMDVLYNNLQLYPNSREAHRQYLSIIYYMEMWSPMIEKSKEALKEFPEDTGFMQLKGIAQMYNENLNESVETFKRILLYSKDSATTVNTLTTIGDLSYRAGNKKEAFKYYRKTLRKEPYHLPALNNYAYFLALEKKQLRRAYRMSKITVEKEPDNPTYLDTYAWILHKMGRNEEALKVLKHAMVYGGNESAEILDHYAEVLYALGERNLAIMYWNQAHKLDPSLGIDKKIETK